MTHRHRRRGFSLTELLVVITLIAVLLGLLFPALAGIRSTGLMTTSMSNLRQIGVWMRMYSNDNREFIVPSRFDYSNNTYKGKVRAPLDKDGSPIDPGVGNRHAGTGRGTGEARPDLELWLREVVVAQVAVRLPKSHTDRRLDQGLAREPAFDGSRRDIEHLAHGHLATLLFR